MKINREEMIDNLEDAMSQLEYVKHGLCEFPSIDQAGLQREMKKVYQFLNLAWNARHLSQDQYLTVCQDEPRFQEMGNFPADIELRFLSKEAKKPSANKTDATDG